MVGLAALDPPYNFVGGGPRLAEVQAAKESGGLDNIRLMDYFPRDQWHASLSVADVHLITMRSEMTGIVVPGKLYGAMASGRPAIFVGPGHCESADAIRQAGCGMTVPLGDQESLVEAIATLAADPEHAAEFGHRGREAFLAEHEKDGCCARWAAMVGDLLEGPPQAIPSPILKKVETSTVIRRRGVWQ